MGFPWSTSERQNPWQHVGRMGKAGSKDGWHKKNRVALKTTRSTNDCPRSHLSEWRLLDQDQTLGVDGGNLEGRPIFTSQEDVCGLRIIAHKDLVLWIKIKHGTQHDLGTLHPHRIRAQVLPHLA